MLLNKKGFTVIELIMSFLFSSILAITLFSVIVSYRGKQTDTSIETELLSFKSHLVMDIQEDIQLKGLKEINYCTTHDSATNTDVTVPRCVWMSYNDGTVKTFMIGFDIEQDEIKNDNGSSTYFSYELPYIIYGDIKYEIPDAASVYIDDDYILTTTSRYDGIETGTNLYKVNFNLKHNDLDTDINISIVANGTVKAPEITGNYDQYSIGDRVLVQLHGLDDQNNEDNLKNGPSQLKFRVIKDSSKLENKVYLLYDDNYNLYVDNNPNDDVDKTLLPDSIDFNVLGNNSNRYAVSSIKGYVHTVEMAWNNAEEVRLLTTEEVARISRMGPQYRGVDSPDVSLSEFTSGRDWLFSSNGNNKSYWTMSEKYLSGDDNGKKVWYVDSINKSLSSDSVDESHALRPVIVIRKSYILHKVTN